MENEIKRLNEIIDTQKQYIRRLEEIVDCEKYKNEKLDEKYNTLRKSMSIICGEARESLERY